MDKKQLSKTVGIIIFVCFIISYIRASYSYLSSDYQVNENDIYPIDTFQLLDRAYFISGKNEKSISIVSSDRHSFVIEKDMIKEIGQLHKLVDTLMYQKTRFIPYTTREYLEKYKNSTSPGTIKIYQIQIGATKFIDIAQVNESNKNALKGELLIATVILIIACAITFKFYKKSTHS